jgi:hypothetical protein
MRKKLLIIFVLLAVIAVFWNHFLLYPLKILVVFFHESSHALMTMLTGGQVKEMVIVQTQGGHVISAGGNRFLSLSAGYLGSLMWGMLIYMTTAASHKDRVTMALLGAGVCVISVVFVSNAFGLMFSIGFGFVMLLSARFLSHEINDVLLRLIAMTNMLYVPLDIYSDTIQRSHLRSDAAMLAEEFGGVTILWGGIWMVISLVAIYSCLKWSFRNEAM